MNRIFKSYIVIETGSMIIDPFWFIYSAEVVRLVCTCPSGCRRQVGIGEHLTRGCVVLVGALVTAAALAWGLLLWSQPGSRQRERLRVEIRVKTPHSHRSFEYQSATSLWAHPLLVQLTVRNQFVVPHPLLIYSALHRIDCFLDVLIVWIKLHHTSRWCHDLPHRWLTQNHSLSARPRFFR